MVRPLFDLPPLIPAQIRVTGAPAPLQDAIQAHRAADPPHPGEWVACPKPECVTARVKHLWPSAK